MEGGQLYGVMKVATMRIIKEANYTDNECGQLSG